MRAKATSSVTAATTSSGARAAAAVTATTSMGHWQARATTSCGCTAAKRRQHRLGARPAATTFVWGTSCGDQHRAEYRRCPDVIFPDSGATNRLQTVNANSVTSSCCPAHRRSVVNHGKMPQRRSSRHPVRSGLDDRRRRREPMAARALPVLPGGAAWCCVSCARPTRRRSSPC